MVFSEEDKVFINVLRQEKVTERNSLSKSLQSISQSIKSNLYSATYK